jgi:hypothetical protein
MDTIIAVLTGFRGVSGNGCKVIPNCDTCARLWRAYASATGEHIRLEDKFKRAALAYDAVALARLTVECEKAAQARQDARQALRDHEGEEHGRAAVV